MCRLKVLTSAGSGRVGVLAGSYPHANSINWEVHERGRPRLYWNNGQVDFTANHDLRTGMWTHLAFVVNENGTTAKCYVNGELVETKTGAFSGVTPQGLTKIGGDYRTNNTMRWKEAEGSFDNLSIWQN